MNYYKWIARCCILLNLSLKEGGSMVEDLSWIAAWDDGLSPTE